jgi:hypothetical protein
MVFMLERAFERGAEHDNKGKTDLASWMGVRSSASSLAGIVRDRRVVPYVTRYRPPRSMLPSAFHRFGLARAMAYS